MKNKELIEKLSKYPDNHEVWVISSPYSDLAAKIEIISEEEVVLNTKGDFIKSVVIEGSNY